MRLLDYLDDILGAFRKQPLRTGLTAVGIGIGAFAITLMVGLGQGLQSYINEQFLAFANERVLIVYPKVFDQAGANFLDRLNSIGRPSKPITAEEEERKRVSRAGARITSEQVEALRALEGVERVEPTTWFEVDGVRLVGADTAHASWYHADMAVLSTNPLMGTPTHGRLPNSADSTEIAISPQFAESWGLPPDDLIGREIEIRIPKLDSVLRRFVFRDPEAYEQQRQVFRARIVGLSERSPLSRMVFPSLELGKNLGRYQSGQSEFLSDAKIGFQAQVRVADKTDPETVKQKILDMDLNARSLSDGLREVNQVFLVVDIVMSSVGLLALLVATLGIVNTLLMAISERTREIGVMKALGMTAPTIRRLFAIEAAAIGLAGGLAGTVLAVGLGLAGDALAKETIEAAAALEGYSFFVFPWWLMIGAPIFSCVIGMLAGIYPANRAARLDPIDALRAE